LRVKKKLTYPFIPGIRIIIDLMCRYIPVKTAQTKQ